MSPSRRPSKPVSRPSNSKRPCCTTSSPDLDLEARALPGRARQAGREVPAAVGKLHQGDRGDAWRGRARSRSSPPDHREAPADRQLVGGQQGLVRDPRDRCAIETSASWICGGKMRKSTRRKLHRPLEQLRETLLRDALEEVLETVRVPDRSTPPGSGRAGRSRTGGRSRGAAPRAAAGSASLLRARTCGTDRAPSTRSPGARASASDAPGELLRELIEVIGLGRAQQGDGGGARLDVDRDART